MKSLRIGNLTAKLPVIQGGMGVGISLSNLAGAVAAEGGVGMISAAQIGYREPDFDADPIGTNLRAMETEIRRAREKDAEIRRQKGIGGRGILGVNIMVATRQYEAYVRTAAAAGIDLIVSGAGLPMNLPDLVRGSATLIAPIVSSVKAAQVILRYWQKKYDRLPDLVVIEGPKAGGHLGFSYEQLVCGEEWDFAEEIKKIAAYVRECARAKGVHIPVVAAGGIYDKRDVEEAMALGVDGVQMATRFVTTYECDASDAYKQAYIHAGKEDITLVQSPVGMPGRAIHNDFLKRVGEGRLPHGKCHLCISTCKPGETPYCITEALVAAVEGDVEKGLIFCGVNAWRANRLEHVSEIMAEIAGAWDGASDEETDKTKI